MCNKNTLKKFAHFLPTTYMNDRKSNKIIFNNLIIQVSTNTTALECYPNDNISLPYFLENYSNVFKADSFAALKCDFY